MTTVQTLIEGGYNRSGANNPGKLAVDGELIAHLNRVYQRAWSLIARARPDEFSAETDLAALVGVPPSASLPANIIDVLAVEDSSGEPVNVIPLTEKWRSWHLAPAVYRQGSSLVSRNAANDPVAGDVLTLQILDAPTALTAMASVLDGRWPARHEQLLVDYVACYLSVKDDGRSMADHQKLMGELAQDVAAFAAEYELAPEAVEWVHADVERQNASRIPA